jgi:hypothetical protein
MRINLGRMPSMRHNLQWRKFDIAAVAVLFAIGCSSAPPETSTPSNVAISCPPAFSDDFTGMGSLDANWIVAFGAFGVSGGAAHATQHASYAAWDGMPEPNASITATIGPPVGPDYTGVFTRANTAAPNRDHIAGYVGPDQRSAVAVRIDYVYTYLAFGPPVGPGPHTLELTATGTNPVMVTLAVDGVTVITTSASSAQALPAGSVGIFGFNGTGENIEHFSVSSTSCVCTPTTCAAHNANCGSIPDGCGGMLDCGSCPAGTTCGGGGVPNQCGSACTPTTCAAHNANCGSIPDGCGGMLNCGTCPAGTTCGGGGVPNQCGSAACTPTTCAAHNATCGSLPNGCGGMLDCGQCVVGTCGGGGVPNQCGGACFAFTDDFPGTGSLDANWIVAFGAFSVSGGAAHATQHASYAAWDGMPAPNASITATIGPPVGPDYTGVFTRASTAVPNRDHIAGYVGPDQRSAVAVRIDYVYTYLAFGPPVGPGPHTLELTATGTNPVMVTLAVDGVTVITTSASSAQALPAGSVGIFGFNGTGENIEHVVVGKPNCNCVPTTCAAHNASCGSIPDGCGGVLDCGSCPAGTTCGGGGVPNQCGSACTPTTCAAQSATCGSIPDGCGGMLNCGTCSSGTTCCSNSCVNLDTDPGNCGSCGNGCANATPQCVAGVCSNCVAPLTNCQGQCVDTQTNVNNCGACLQVCLGGDCVGGVCTCPMGTTNCGGGCVNTVTDGFNCGACGHNCGAGQCLNSACFCNPGNTLCSGTCVNTATDSKNCGACGNTCPAGQTCSASACVACATAGLTNCGGTCVDLTSDSSNCGACGNACVAGEFCSGSVCMVSASCGCGFGGLGL